MHRVFLSDIHLEDDASNHFKRFVECLTIEAERADEIYLLGDIVEMWIGDDDTSALVQALRELISGASGSSRIYLSHGNRDFLIGEAFCETTGMTLLSDPHRVNEEMVVGHGDALCIDDHEYQQMRTMFRSPEWQSNILSQTLEQRAALGASLRAQSKANNANKATNIMDVNSEAVDQLMTSNNARVFIHGHTHRPGIHQLAHGTRVVLGAWERCGWLARQQDDALQLECFSLAIQYR